MYELGVGVLTVLGGLMALGILAAAYIFMAHRVRQKKPEASRTDIAIYVGAQVGGILGFIVVLAFLREVGLKRVIGYSASESITGLLAYGVFLVPIGIDLLLTKLLYSPFGE
jgi:predicted membrane protein